MSACLQTREREKRNGVEDAAQREKEGTSSTTETMHGRHYSHYRTRLLWDIIMNFPTTNDDDDISAEPRFTDRDGDKVTPLRLLLFSFFSLYFHRLSVLYVSLIHVYILRSTTITRKRNNGCSFLFDFIFFCQMNRMSHLSRATSIRLQPIATQQVNLDKI